MEDMENIGRVNIVPSGWPDNSNTQPTHEEEKCRDSVVSATTRRTEKPSRTDLHVSTRQSNQQESYMNMLSEFLTKEEFRHAKLRYACYVWPNGTTIRWTCMNGAHYQEQFVCDILYEDQAWTYGANLAFRYRYNGSKDKRRRTEVRIEFQPKIHAHSKFGIYGAYIPRNCPTMWLNEGCDAETIAHEFGHAIGLGHEHQRWISDVEFDLEHARAQVARRNYGASTSDQPGSDPEMQIFSKDECTRIDPFEYDPNSVMHYDLGFLDSSAFKSPPPAQKETVRQYDEPNVGWKDRKLVAYLYPLPTGGTVRPKRLRQAGTRTPKSRSQSVMLPHVWSTTCRVMVGINELRWCGEDSSSLIKARVAARSQKGFHVDTIGSASQVDLSYLAIDPAVAHVQLSSHKSYLSRLHYKSIDPEADHCWQHHRLRWDTSRKAKILFWINELKVPASARGFGVSVHPTVSLSWSKKEVGVQIRSIGGAKASVNWIVINPGAINIDGGQIQWHASTGTRAGKVQWKLGLFENLHHRDPKVMIGINGLTHSSCKAHGLGEEVWFRVKVGHIDEGGFAWEVHTCHDECFSELSFSWLVVPPALLSFDLPKANKKPKPLPAPWCKREKRNQQPVAEDAYEEVGALFDGGSEMKADEEHRDERRPDGKLSKVWSIFQAGISNARVWKNGEIL